MVRRQRRRHRRLQSDAGRPADRHVHAGSAPPRSAPDDWRSRHPFFQEPQLSKNLQLVDGLRPIAARLGISVAQLVLAWVLRDPAMTSAIAGARSPKQIQETVAAGNVDLPPAVIAEIEQLLHA